jgi:hypothetical protein
LRIAKREVRTGNNIAVRRRLESLRRKIVSCGADVTCVQGLQKRVAELSGQLDAVKSVYQKLKSKLARCLGGLNGEPCRSKIMRRFRRRLEAKELVLLRQLQDSSRSRFRREVLSCQRNLLGNPAGIQDCLSAAKATLSERIGDLKARELRLNQRGAVRQCAHTADAKGCIALVEAEYKKDAAIARDDAAAAANILLSKLQSQTQWKKKKLLQQQQKEKGKINK